jgi:acetylornithine deacetylase
VSQPIPAAEILRALVAIPTPSAISNLPLLQWVAAFLEPRGWQMQWLRWTDEAGIAKANLIARPSSQNSPIALAFFCHTDTVPFATDWHGALTLEPHENHLHGCGSCDVKGALACFLAAVSAAMAEDLPTGIALILTADEEVGCKGMDRLLASESGLRIATAIVSEPTSLQPGIAGKGYGLAPPSQPA